MYTTFSYTITISLTATSYTIVTIYKPLSYILVSPPNLKVDAAVDSIVTGYVYTLGSILLNLYTI
jgi:hypothetical protein